MTRFGEKINPEKFEQLIKESSNNYELNQDDPEAFGKEDIRIRKELDSVINSEVEGAVDANSATQDSTQNIFGTDSYEENALDKQLRSSNEATSKEWQKEDKEAEMAEAQNEDLKQRVIQVLKRFKGETQAIEQLRETNPQAYTATLDLVNTMLQLARTLGLAGGNDEESTSVEEGLESPENNELEKKLLLPHKQTTRHIPKSRRPMGSVDNKGREKILDEEGDINWVDRKKGVVKDLTGKIVRRDDE